MAATPPAGGPPVSVHPSASLPAALAATQAAAPDGPSAPLPVFASGNAQLEQRLLQTFAALRMPREPPAAAAAGADLEAAAADSENPDSALSAVAAVEHAEEQLATRQTPAAAAAGAELAPSPADVDATRTTATTTTAGQVAATVASSDSSGAPPTASSQEPLARTLAQVAAPSTGSDVATRGRVVGEQQVTLRRSTGARGESPGACSEATDSTRCTDTSEVVRPPAFGTWRHYSLADVPEEAMSAAGMQRAVQHMLQQLRRSTATAETPSTAAAAAAPGSSAASPTASGATAASAPAAGTAATAVDTEPGDPRVRVGPRRRALGQQNSSDTASHFCTKRD